MTERDHLVEAVQSGDMRRSLIALRDLLANELEGERCGKCSMLQIRSGETAALALRLQKVLEDIAALPPENGEVSRLELIRGSRAPAPSDSAPSAKSGQRRQGGRRAGGLGRPSA